MENPGLEFQRTTSGGLELQRATGGLELRRSAHFPLSLLGPCPPHSVHFLGVKLSLYVYSCSCGGAKAKSNVKEDSFPIGVLPFLCTA